MRLRMIRLALAASIALVISLDAFASEPKVKLTKYDKKVIDHLVKNWGEDYDVTSVDVAMESLKMKPSASTRLRLGTYIKQNPELHEVIRQWGWVTIVLNADEKLIARALINAERASKPSPSVAEIARAVLDTEDQVKRGLTTLERYGIVQRDKSKPNPGYRIAPRFIKWEPRLDFIFHTVTLADGRKFNVNWAIDSLLLVSSKYANETVVVDTSSPESTTRIRAVFEKGKLANVDPASAIAFHGGGWGVINFFRSEEALQNWLKRFPELKDRMRGSLAVALEFIKARQKK